MKAKRIMRSALSLVLAASLALGGYVLPAKAADTFNYVSLGASNTNGYGLKGYFTDSEITKIKNREVTKEDINSVGYGRTPEGSYPGLVRDSLAKSHNKVNFEQLAMSYMRAEDLRVLLDNNYNGDAYTKGKFTGGTKWFSKVESGGLSALREKYQKSVKNADLITVDLGWENFGTYLIEQLMGYFTDGKIAWSADLDDLFDTKAELAAANEVKAQVKGYVSQFLTDDKLADLTSEVLAYTMLSYVDSFDAVIAKIYELNPDAQVVVVGTQNLLYDAKLSIGGETFDAGAIFGEFVNMANYYMSARCPYSDQYLYVKAGSNEHATMFMDVLSNYKVKNPANLNANIKDCFDIYDEDILLETTMKEAIRSDETLSSLESLIESMGGYDIADDTLAEILRVGLTVNPVDISNVSGDIAGAAEKLINYVVDEIVENVTDGILGDYTVDTAEITNDPLLSAVAAVYVRAIMGHGFFNHLSEDGHSQTASAITNIVSNPSSEKEQALSAEFKEMVIANQQALCEARGHEETVEKVTKEATCTEAGEKTVTCKACGLGETKKIPVKDHEIDGGIEKATTKEDGMINGTCKACGQEFHEVIPFPESIKLSYTSTTYNGKVKKPSVTVKGSDGKAIDKANYSVSYASGRKNVGKYKVTIKFKGDYYKGSVSKTFTIKPKSTTISSLTKASKAITVKWKKQATQTTGYEIQIATNTGFSKNKKTTTITKTGTTSKKITGLKAKTKYYVRIRTYKTVKVNGKSTKIYSSWSAVKNVKTK